MPEVGVSLGNEQKRAKATTKEIQREQDIQLHAKLHWPTNEWNEYWLAIGRNGGGCGCP